MSRFLAAWELGANRGHIDRLLMLANALRERGHETVFALRDLSRAHALLVTAGYRVVQAPVWLASLARPSQAPNYCATLEHAGWLSATGLAGLLHGWRTCFDLLQPDALLADFAPTALLAARGRTLPLWGVGTSFELPPAGPHFPPLVPGRPGVDAACAAADARLLQPVDEALALLQQPPLARLTDVFAGVHRALMSVPELHHYGVYREPVVEPGTAFLGDAGEPPAWPDGPGPRAFAYLQPAHPDFRAALQALQAGGWAALVHAPGLTEASVASLGSARVRVSRRPLAVAAAVAEADVVVSHGSAGLANAAALGGKPQLALPRHAEQSMVALRIAEARIGLAAPLGSTADGLQALLRRLVDEPSFATAAAALAQRRAGMQPAESVRRLAGLIDASLAGTQERQLTLASADKA